VITTYKYYVNGFILERSMGMPLESLLRTVQDCEAMCEQTLTAVSGMPDVEIRTMQLRLLRDCADICGLTAKYIARDSMFTKALANLCADVCDVCGCECAKFPDCISQHCAQVCFHCARECRMFAMM
jgi:hypothetical protein